MCVLVYRFVRIEFLERIFLSPRTNPDKARSALLLGLWLFFETQRHRDTERSTSVGSVSPCFQSPRKIGCLVCGSFLKHGGTETQRDQPP
jgi:hypothetical protein